MSNNPGPGLALLLLLLSSTVVFGQEELSKFEKWTGHWKTVKNGNSIHETWKRLPDGSFEGESWTLTSRGDSVHNEFIRLHMLNDNIYYEPRHSSGGKEKPVAFRLIISSGKEWIFSNPDNDFPKYIQYRWLDEHHLQATISNSDSDSQEAVIFNYEKTKP